MKMICKNADKCGKIDCPHSIEHEIIKSICDYEYIVTKPLCNCVSVKKIIK
jgi:hypothetical protein